MDGVAEVLPFAIGVAISPVPIIAVILMLFSARAKVNGPMFLLGWVSALAIVSFAVYFASDASRFHTGDQVLIDGNWDFVGSGNTRRIVKGDATCLSISAASILAKVTRDRFMHRADALHPGWEFRSHVGYSTPEHRDAIMRLGVSPLHRMSFASTAYQQLTL
mgnify:CR=1 FL=1